MRATLYWIDGVWPGRLAIVPRPRGDDWLEDGGHLHGGVDGTLGLADGGLQFAVLLDDVLAALVILFADGGELQWPRRAVDQLDAAEVLLQLQHDLADGRLGTAVGRGRLREAAVPGHVTEDLQELQLHRDILCSGFSNIKQHVHKKT